MSMLQIHDARIDHQLIHLIKTTKQIPQNQIFLLIKLFNEHGITHDDCWKQFGKEITIKGV